MNTKPLGTGPLRSPRIASLFYPLRQTQHHPRLGYRGRYPPPVSSMPSAYPVNRYDNPADSVKLCHSWTIETPYVAFLAYRSI